MLNETRQIFRRRRKKYVLIGLAALLVLGVSLYFLPPIRSRVDSRLETWRAEFKYLLHPPENVVFVPTEHQQSTPTAGPTRTPTATPLPDVPTEIPTATSTPLPGEVKLTGIVYANQCN